MAFDAEVEASKFVVAETISTKLHYNCMGTILCHNALHDVFEKFVERVVIHSGFERYIERVVFSIVLSILIEASSSREKIFPVLMEGNGHYSVRQVEGFLHTVSMMHIDIDVDDSGIDEKKLQNCQNDVIHITKPARL